MQPMQGGMPPGMQQPGMQPPGIGPGGYPQAPQGGPNKTVMLQPSEGVVSVARTGQASSRPAPAMIHQGASTLFWVVSLIIGVAVGALAYSFVLQTM